MNPPIFLRSKAGKDPQKLIDEMYNKVHAKGVTYRDKVELSSYQLKYVVKCSTQTGKAIGRMSLVFFGGKNLKKFLLANTLPMR